MTNKRFKEIIKNINKEKIKFEDLIFSTKIIKDNNELNEFKNYFYNLKNFLKEYLFLDIKNVYEKDKNIIAEKIIMNNIDYEYNSITENFLKLINENYNDRNFISDILDKTTKIIEIDKNNIKKMNLLIETYNNDLTSKEKKEIINTLLNEINKKKKILNLNFENENGETKIYNNSKIYNSSKIFYFYFEIDKDNNFYKNRNTNKNKKELYQIITKIDKNILNKITNIYISFQNDNQPFFITTKKDIKNFIKQPLPKEVRDF